MVAQVPGCCSDWACNDQLGCCHRELTGRAVVQTFTALVWTIVQTFETKAVPYISVGVQIAYLLSALYVESMTW